MPQPNNAQRKAKLIQLIHIGKSQIGMPDAEYRALLANVSHGKTSSKSLTLAQLETVLRHIKAQGFMPAVATTGGQILRHRQPEQLKKIRSLWLELHEMGVVRSPQESALHRYCAKYGGADWQDDVYAMRDIIERLKQWRARFE